jgi:integrase
VCVVTNWNESLGEGIRRDHRAACASSKDRKPNRSCGCPFSFWVPDPSKKGGQRRAKIDGAMSFPQARKEKERLVVVARAHARNAANQSHESPTLFEWAQRCFAKTWADKSPGTIASREQAYRLYIHDHLGSHTLGDITPLVVSDWFTAIEDAKGRSRATEIAGETLRAMLNVAVKLQLIERSPVTDIPRVSRREVRERQRWLTESQYHQLVGSCIDLADRVLIRVATECCLRRGELAALRWRDIDFDAHRITVTRSMKKGIHRPRIEGGRKAGGIATPSFGPDLANELARYFSSAQVYGASLESPVWPGRGRRGEPWQLDTPMIADAMGRRLSRIVKGAGLVDDNGQPIVSSHGLRRTGASIAATSGVPEVIVQNQLGHATANTTREFYVRRTDEAQQAQFAAVFN